MDFTLGFQTLNSAINEPLFEIFCGTVADKIEVIEIGISLVAGTATVVGLCRPTAAGTPTASINFLPIDTDEDLSSAPATAVVNWNPAGDPVDSTDYLRMIGFPATVGAGVIWDFCHGVSIKSGESITLFNLTGGACSLLNCYVTIRV